MSNDKTSEPKTASKTNNASARAERQGEALRANLKRRKQQTHARKTPAKSPKTATDLD